MINPLKQHRMITVSYDEAEFRPRKLSAEEIAHPDQVVEDFFDYANMPQVRGFLWEIFKTMVSCSYPGLKRREKASLIYFYEQVEKLLEAIHVMHDQKNQEDEN